ncbi:unnamed protein product [Medioppia subpectinata]|uniref:Uncharacterized protein n=1 Tax=Medioppia subpectinata TaxID=1979941 RepID=A0A7R9KPX3_9ACAR|nr:unnamed protein product [Medioppia subpectinata]CAG2107321.1 unnamed protein product [Medioppia subpectinata]
MAYISLLSYKILVLSWITAQRQLIHDKTVSRTQWDKSYDFIVVGAGAAGAVVANKLSECQSVRVLLLEAGGAQSAIYNDIPGMVSKIYTDNVNKWKYYNEPHDNYGQQYAGGRVPDQRGKTLGGSTAHNTMYYNRGNRRDFDEWANTYGAVGWSYRDVLPVFREWENNTDPVIVANNPDYHGTHPEDQVNIVDAVRMQFYLLEVTDMAKYIQPLPSFADIGCPVCPGKYMYECSEGLKCYIRFNSLSSYHPAGSCRMGAIERPDVVVDPQLRVKGANNLRVCDASVFPVIPNANTAAAAITVGYKCAQIIKDYYHLND